MLKTDVSRLMNKVANLDVAPRHLSRLVADPWIQTCLAAASGRRRSIRLGFGMASRRCTGCFSQGATAALALLRAGESELVKLHDASAVAACTRCHGLCWFVTNAGTVEYAVIRKEQKSLSDDFLWPVLPVRQDRGAAEQCCTHAKLRWREEDALECSMALPKTQVRIPIFRRRSVR
jgi:hypothetical protein